MSALEGLCAEVDVPKHAQRLTRHVLAQLACLGDHTITGLLTTCGRQFQDWSADYRLYGRERVRPEDLFAPVRLHLLEQDGPVVTAMDDTQLPKTGRKVYGAKFMRDSLGPAFRANLQFSQRFVQTSIAWQGEQGQARMIPADWMHAPLPVKPKAKAGCEQWAAYHEQKKAACLSRVGLQRIAHLRQWLDHNNAQHRPLWSCVDGSYTNGTVLKNLPGNTILVGRIRADAKLCHLPQEQPTARGRKRVYGPQAPTPEQLRNDEGVPWQTVEVFFGGKIRTVRVKQLSPLRWRTAGQRHDLQLLVLAPTSYRLSKNSKLLYRKPAFLICTDPHADPVQVIQRYLWRWDIEVNFRDEKTLFGLGDAQVRTPSAVQNVTGCAVAAYAMLVLAAALSHCDASCTGHLPPPKWQRRQPQRTTTQQMKHNLRHELWARSINFSGFAVHQQVNAKPEKNAVPLESALFYASEHS